MTSRYTSWLQVLRVLAHALPATAAGEKIVTGPALVWSSLFETAPKGFGVKGNKINYETKLTHTHCRGRNRAGRLRSGASGQRRSSRPWLLARAWICPGAFDQNAESHG
jgi:hypothetical protein